MLFEQLNQKRCVVFFDEFEVLGKERGDDAELGEIKRVVSALLMHMDSLMSNVVFIGATNHSELLDRAVWRRFDVALNLDNPNQSLRQQWLNDFSSNVQYDFSPYIPHILSQTDNASFAELEKLMLAIWRKYILQSKQGDLATLIDKSIVKWKNS